MSVTNTCLQCPVCEAPFPPESDRYYYCGSILAPKTTQPRIDPRLLNRSVVDEHIAGYRRELRSDPHDAIARYGLGVAYLNLELVDAAVQELTEAARVMPENPNTQTQIAVALREAWRLGDASARDQMEYRIETVLHLEPSTVEARRLREELRDATGGPVPATTGDCEFWQRAIAIDGLLLAMIGGLLTLLIDGEATRCVPAIGWLSFATMERSMRQATIGKSLKGITVASTDGGRIFFLRATGRSFARILSAFPAFFGEIMVLFTTRRQALHGLVASTRVLTR